MQVQIIVYVFCLLTTWGLCLTESPLDQVNPYSGCIDQIRQGNMHTFNGIIINNTKDTLIGHYTMETIRSGHAGRSVSMQNGPFSVPGHTKETVCTVTINIDDKDSYNLLLKAYTNDELFFTDTIIAGNDKNNDYQ